MKVHGRILEFPEPSVEEGLLAMEFDQAPMADEAPTEVGANGDRGRPRATASNVGSKRKQRAPSVKSALRGARGEEKSDDAPRVPNATAKLTSSQQAKVCIKWTDAGFQELEEYLAKLEGSRVVAW